MKDFSRWARDLADELSDRVEEPVEQMTATMDKFRSLLGVRAETEEEKAREDLTLYGNCFMLDGKHIPLKDIVFKQEPEK